jgi:hypothetical protein
MYVLLFNLCYRCFDIVLILLFFPIVLCVKLSFTTDEVVISVQLMNLLFSFLKPDHPHGTLSAGYFAKVLLCICFFLVEKSLVAQ